MNANEARDLLVQREQDIAAEPDPEVRTWYRLESELQPDVILAKRTLAEIEAIANLVGRLASSQETQDTVPNELGVTPEDVEALSDKEFLTPDELLNRRIERHYILEKQSYEAEIASISTAKKSKREHQQMLARRQFARRFNDISGITGDNHLVLRADLLGSAVYDMFEDELLAGEVIADCAEYAKRHSLEVTNSPANFAKIIGLSVAGRPYADKFEAILKGVFSTETSNFFKLYSHLANASFELFEDQEATTKLAKMVHLDESFVPMAFIVEPSRQLDKLAATNNTEEFIEAIESAKILRAVTDDITGVGSRLSPRLGDLQSASAELGGIFAEFRSIENPDPVIAELVELLYKIARSGEYHLNYDPVEVTHIGTNFISSAQKDKISPELRKILNNSNTFNKRMRELAPYSYASQTAKQILASPGVHGLLIPLSPSITLDVYFPSHANKLAPSEEELQVVSERILELYPQLLANALAAQKNGLEVYRPDGKLKMFCQELFEDIRQGVILYRPSIALDRRSHNPLQQLVLSYVAAKSFRYMQNSENHESSETENLKDNLELRNEINARQKRFFGRRPVKFSMPATLNQMAGLISVSLRYEPKYKKVICDFELDDGQVELRLDRNLCISEKGKVSIEHLEMKAYYENLILKLAKSWMCNHEVHTSEGTISEQSGNSANMGHFAYLRIREDGRRYHFSETQRLACLEEQSKDLASESERLKYLDPTGRLRNSTYVRENYDPAKPPLEVYIDAEQLS